MYECDTVELYVDAKRSYKKSTRRAGSLARRADMLSSFATLIMSVLSPAKVCFGEKSCTPLDSAAPPQSGWICALPSASLIKGDPRRNCVKCNHESLSRSPAHPNEVWNVSQGIGHMRDVDPNALWFVANSSHKLGWVPPLLPQQKVETSGWRHYVPKAKLAVYLPCSSTRGEDAAILRTFFTDRTTGAPLRGGTFLEIGGANGLEQSNSWIFEVCLGWKGVLAEAHPKFFAQLARNRPASLNIHFAACSPEMGGWANFTARRWTGAKIVTAADVAVAQKRQQMHQSTKQSIQISALDTVSVQCGQLGDHLNRLDVRRLDFLSVDVEGSELTVLQSLDHSRLTIGVVLVEVRGDGVRPRLMKHMLRQGMRYIGQFNGRSTAANAIIDDVYVNFTHLATYFPTSAALQPRRRRSGVRRSGSQ